MESRDILPRVKFYVVYRYYSHGETGVESAIMHFSHNNITEKNIVEAHREIEKEHGYDTVCILNVIPLARD